MSLTAALPTDTLGNGASRRSRSFLVLLIVLGFLLGPVLTAPAALGASGRLTSFDQRMLELVNKARKSAGLNELQAANGLVDLSVWWSSQMADGATGAALQHNPNAFQMTLSFGASNRTAWAENVAKWSPTSVSADTMFDAYMNSPGHKANIMGANYRYIGIGSVTGANGTSYNTMTFTDRVDPGQASVPAKPKGSLDVAALANGRITVRGWAYDPNEPATSIPVHVYVNGAGTALTANGSRGDVNSAFGLTGAHGYEGNVTARQGKNTVCVFAISVTGTDNTLVSCTDVMWETAKPARGSLDGLSRSGRAVKLAGWAYDPSSPNASAPVHVYVNGVGTAVTADQARPDVNAAFGLGGNHGLSASVPLPAGKADVCVFAISVSGGANTLLGCRSVTAAANPIGAVDTIARVGDSIRVSGWAFDPGASSDSTPVHVYVNGVGTALATDEPRGDVNSVFRISGNHGYADTVPAPAGPAQVCVFAISVSGADNVLKQCRTV